MIGWSRPLVRENLAETDPPYSKTPIFNQSVVVLARFAQRRTWKVERIAVACVVRTAAEGDKLAYAYIVGL